MSYSSTEGGQGICPVGWHIPTDSEWHTLEDGLTTGSCDANPAQKPLARDAEVQTIAERQVKGRQITCNRLESTFFPMKQLENQILLCPELGAKNLFACPFPKGTQQGQPMI